MMKIISLKENSEICAENGNRKIKWLLEPDAKKLCSQYGIPVTNFKVVKTRNEALKAADEIGYPVVLKIVSPDIIHKSDVEGVILNLRTSQEAAEAYDNLLKRVICRVTKVRIEGVLIEEMAPPAREVIVGATKDQQFGPTIMFGLGGIFVDILKDVSFRIIPITEYDALEMIKELRTYPILKGYRNSPPTDINAIKDILLKVSKMVTEHSDIQELDLNPLIVYERGAKLVDARIIFE